MGLSNCFKQGKINVFKIDEFRKVVYLGLQGVSYGAD